MLTIAKVNGLAWYTRRYLHRMSRSGRAAIVLLAMSATSPAQGPVSQPVSGILQGSASSGQDLFTGVTHFRNRGPACIACHSIGGLPFPNGGTLGPDLTHAYRKLGPSGTRSAMQTLFFRVMTPIYGPRPLVPQEQADLMAFLQQSESRAPSQGNTLLIVLIAVLGGALFVALTGFLWKDRVKSVRRTLVHKARGQGVRL